MLTQEIKRKIDSARDILVGKVSDPKAQVEQITTALIYKFMDDMDKGSMALLKGKAQFFTDGYGKYAWNKLMDPKLGGHERLNLYSEAIIKMSQNPHLPQLFRDIFKDAFLPYRDPETLSLFLKEINGFIYDHSENLGDAYEYLLSILSVQGDIGSLRTPRHIIDFIVEVVGPQKDEMILDPACGTAGFLICAYKYILKANKEKPLTPDEKKLLMKNLIGYDISPDMVKLSLVNMYLHGFPDPHIHEYDTLTSEEHWDERYDVIMANPPFMTPKGGIRPHKRFSVQANRSEVLFVAYIMEHLNNKGRAGIIVPEGIIFQSSNAYKQLRKMLVEDGLWAVVSLPQGAFNPYSGVKTSILFFSNPIARQTKEILFVKVENDGFDLGAQRRPIDRNDLPTRFALLNKYKKAVQDGKKFNLSKGEENFASVIKKEKIAENGDYNLSADRYLAAVDYTDTKCPMVKLKDVCDLESGSRQKGGAVDRGVYSIGGEQISEDNTIRFEKMKYITEAHFTEMKKGVLFKNDVLMVKDGATTGKMGFWGFDFKAAVNEHVFIFRAKKGLIEPKLLFNLLRSGNFQESLQPFIKGIIGGISLEIKQLQIPLPPIEVQQQIVAELDSYQKIIDGARAVAENWKPSFEIDPTWETKKLGAISEKITKGTTPTTAGFKFQEKGINFVKIESIDDNGYFIPDKFAHIDSKCNEALKRSQLKTGDVLFSIAGALGRVALVNVDILPANTNQALAIITPKANLDSEYLEQVLRSPIIFNKIDNLKVGVAQYNISLNQVADFEIPLPPLKVQKEIVVKIKEEQKIIEANKELVSLFEQKIKDKISDLWGA